MQVNPFITGNGILYYIVTCFINKLSSFDWGQNRFVLRKQTLLIGTDGPTGYPDRTVSNSPNGHRMKALLQNSGQIIQAIPTISKNTQFVVDNIGTDRIGSRGFCIRIQGLA